MTEETAPGHLSAETVDRLWGGANELRDSLVAFTQKLIRTPSLPGQEQDVAPLVAAEMRALGYDEVNTDEAGNVIGLIRARGDTAGRERRSIMFNAHMDHVDVGDHARWPYPPYDATLADGEIWGRGTSDLKGSLASQVYAGALLKKSGIDLPNDVYVAGVVLEEVGGLGSAHLAKHLKTDFAVIGEPSANVLALGHRGRIEMIVTITGKSVHASVPQTGENPLYSMARFLDEVRNLHFEIDPDFPFLGATTVAPTLITTDQTSANVVPGECQLILDFRNAPKDTPELLLKRVQELLSSSLVGEATGVARINAVTLKSYTGLTGDFSNAAPPFGTSPDGYLAVTCGAALTAALRRDMTTKIWPFATDAGHLVGVGIEVIGFGPGYENVIHTVLERIPVDMMVEAMVGNAAIALAV